MTGSGGPNTSGYRASPPREATYLESDEEIRHAIQAIKARQTRRTGKAAVGPPALPPADDAAARLDNDTRPERPQDRPPMALLCIVDDGKVDGEWIRLRGDRCLIGRTEGAICIPHDNMMSGRHAELVRIKMAAGYRWMLLDQKSTNGTFVRVGSAVLFHQAEFLVGRGHYQFEAGLSGPAPGENAPEQLAGGTVPWLSDSIRSIVPALVEITPSGIGQRITLNQPEYWIGRDATTCQIVRIDDLLVNARHARLHRDAKDQWHAENNKSVNGLWLRIEQMPLTGNCQFRLGEQRFLFRVL